MSRLGSQITDSGAEPQSESLGNKIIGRLADALENVKTPREYEDEGDYKSLNDEIEIPRERYAQSEVSGDMDEATDRDWGRPVDPQGLSYGSGYNISVETLTSGYILRVGCQSIAVESGADVGKLIGLHLTDKTAGDKWMSSEKIVQTFLQENLQVK